MTEILYALAAAPDSQLCFAAGTTGLHRSEDGGRTWGNALAALGLAETPPLAAVALSPTFLSDGIVLAGTAGGVLRSIDSGITWDFLSFGSPPPFVSTLAFSPNFERDGLIFAGTLEDGIFVSRNRGASWHTWNFGLLDLHILALALSPNFAEDETLFVAVESGIFCSTNGGRAWREIPFDLDDAPVLSLAISPNFRADSLVYAGTEARGLFQSEDAGRSWQRVAAAILTDSVDAIVLAPDFPDSPHLLALAGGEVLISPDLGETWQPRSPREAPDATITAVLALAHLTTDSPLLVGVADEGVKLI